MDENSSFEPRDSDFSPESPPYCPGLILQPDEDPSSYNYLSAPEAEVNPSVVYFDIGSLSSPDTCFCPIPQFTEIGKGHAPAKKKKFVFRYIQSLRKSLQQHGKNQFPMRAMHCVKTENQRKIWKKLRSFYLIHTEELQFWRNVSLSDLQVSGQQDRILHNCFSSPAMRTYNFLFSELIFTDEIENLCKKTDLLCCGSSTHSIICNERWVSLKEYMSEGLLRELTVEMTAEDRRRTEELQRD